MTTQNQTDNRKERSLDETSMKSKVQAIRVKESKTE